MTFAEKFDYLGTLKHFFTNLAVNLSHANILPDFSFVSVNDITPKFLEEKGIEAVIWDVDGTLMRYHGNSVDESIKAAFFRLISEKGLRHAILSNSGEKRFSELGDIFPAIPILRMYESNTGIIERRLYKHNDHFAMKQKGAYYFGDRNGLELNYDLSFEAQKESRNTYARIISQMYHTIKKPDTRLIEYAMKELGISEPKKVAMIGDRAFTDITGGNQAGVWTIYLSPPMHPETDPLLIKMFARPAEVLFVRRYDAVK